MKLALPIQVEVTWLDPASDGSEAGEAREIQETNSKLQTVVSVGWLVKVGKEQLVLATDVAPGDKVVKVIHRIPRGVVREVVLLGRGQQVCFRGRGVFTSGKRGG